MSTRETLPQPIDSEASGASDGYNEAAAAQMTERHPAASAGSAAITAVVVDDAQSRIQVAQSTVPQPALGQTWHDDSSLSAEDLDLIEKMWVKKAKEIVLQTSHDPAEQNLQLNRVKAEYIKKRYNKDIKVRG